MHAEVQGYKDDEFALRMWEYQYRIWDRYHRNIVAIAVFSDESEDYKPSVYQKSYFGTEIIYRYNTYKIVGQDKEALKQIENPFALVVLATIYAIESKKNEELRFGFKRTLLTMLVQLKWDRARIEKIFLFLDFIIAIEDEEKNTIIFNEFKKLLMGGDDKMVLTWETSSLAKSARKAGLEEGKKEGKKELAMNMLRENCDIHFVAKISGLSLAMLEEMQKKI